VSDSPPHEKEVKTTTPLTSPVKSSHAANITHASSAPSSVGISGPESRGQPPLTPSDSDEGEKNKKKVLFRYILPRKLLYIKSVMDR